MFEYFIVACLIAVYFIVGALFDSLTYRRYSLPFSIVAGFICVNALFFLIAYPFRAMGLSFTLLTYVFSVLLAAVVLAGAYSLIRCGGYRNYVRNIFDFYNSDRWLKIIICVLIVAFSAFSFTLSLKENPDSDDSMYMAKAMEIQNTDSLQLHESVYWLGWETDLMTDSTDASTLEAFYAYISAVSGLPVAVLCRKTILLTISLIIYCTVFNLGSNLFKDECGKIKSLIMLLVYIGLSVVFNAVFDSIPYRQIMSPWHGKTIVAAIIFPLIMGVCADIYSHADKVVWHEWIYLALIITASISASIIGVNFTIIYCVVMAAPLLIFRLVARKKVVHLLLPAVVAALPAIIFSGIALLKVITSNNTLFTRFDLPSWSHCFYRTFMADSSGVILLLFVASILYFVIKGNTEQRLIFVGTTAFLFVSFLNPLLLTFVSKYLTTGAIYWRLYWVIPIWTAIPAAVADAIMSQGRDKAAACLKGAMCMFTFTFLVLFAYFGTFSNAFLSSAVRCWYPPRLNSYGISEDTRLCAQYILDDKYNEEANLLDLSSRANGAGSKLFAIRQYTADIDLCVGIRDNQVALMTDIIDGEDISVAEFVNKVCTSREVLDKDMLKNAIIHMQADYVFAPRDILPDNDFLTLLLNCEEHVLMRVEIAQ